MQKWSLVHNQPLLKTIYRVLPIISYKERKVAAKRYARHSKTLEAHVWLLSVIFSRQALSYYVEGGRWFRALAPHKCVPVSIPGPSVICGWSFLLVLSSAPRDCSPGPLLKPTFPNSNSIMNCQAL